MKPILGREGLKILQKFAQSKTALVLDYDGTLTPIVPHQTQAKMSAKTTKLVRELCSLYPTAVLSGRRLRDVRARMKGTSLREIVGNHGLEWSGSGSLNARSRRFEKAVSVWKREILRAMKTCVVPAQGIEIEDKKVSLSIHYRQAENRTRAKREFIKLLQGLSGLKIIEGKCVINVLPDVHVNKGTAVLELKKKLRCDRVIFVGDDKTDENAFALRSKSFLLDVRVGKSSQSQARYFLPRQKAMDHFLERLIDFRA